MDPRTGRFMSSDPISDFAGVAAYRNKFAYAANDPVNNIDPSGLSPADDALLGSQVHFAIGAVWTSLGPSHASNLWIWTLVGKGSAFYPTFRSFSYDFEWARTRPDLVEFSLPNEIYEIKPVTQFFLAIAEAVDYMFDLNMCDPSGDPWILGSGWPASPQTLVIDSLLAPNVRVSYENPMPGAVLYTTSTNNYTTAVGGAAALAITAAALRGALLDGMAFVSQVAVVVTTKIMAPSSPQNSKRGFYVGRKICAVEFRASGEGSVWRLPVVVADEKFAQHGRAGDSSEQRQSFR
jgi:hypothetical protein